MFTKNTCVGTKFAQDWMTKYKHFIGGIKQFQILNSKFINIYYFILSLQYKGYYTHIVKIYKLFIILENKCYNVLSW